MILCIIYDIRYRPHAVALVTVSDVIIISAVVVATEAPRPGTSGEAATATLVVIPEVITLRKRII